MARRKPKAWKCAEYKWNTPKYAQDHISRDKTIKTNEQTYFVLEAISIILIFKFLVTFGSQTLHLNNFDLTDVCAFFLNCAICMWVVSYLSKKYKSSILCLHLLQHEWYEHPMWKTDMMFGNILVPVRCFTWLVTCSI